MNLKEAFHFQNKLQSMMADAQSILATMATSPRYRTPTSATRSWQRWRMRSRWRHPPPSICLQIADAHPTLDAKTDDVLSGRNRINDRKLLRVHGNRLHLKSLPKREYSRILEEASKSKSKRNFVKKLSHKEVQS